MINRARVGNFELEKAPTAVTIEEISLCKCWNHLVRSEERTRGRGRHLDILAETLPLAEQEPRGARCVAGCANYGQREIQALFQLVPQRQKNAQI